MKREKKTVFVIDSAIAQFIRLFYKSCILEFPLLDIVCLASSECLYVFSAYTPYLYGK